MWQKKRFLLSPDRELLNPITLFFSLNSFLKIPIAFISIILFFTSSCIVVSPKYTTLEKTMMLKPGMTQHEVEELLGVHPYDIKSASDSLLVLTYVYRVTSRRTLSFNTKAVNGSETPGKYIQLDVTYTNDNHIVSVESCRICPDNLVTTSKIDFAKMLVFVTVTLPVLLIYFGLKQ